MKIITYINVHKILIAPIALGLVGYFNLMKAALFPGRRFEEAQPTRIGLPFVFLPLAGYAQMTVMVGVGALSLSSLGDKYAQMPEFCH
jgi:hypothetical protein